MARSLDSTYSRLAELPLAVERYERERLSQQVSRGFELVRTVVHLHGRGDEGLGEDVTWYAEAHGNQPELALAGDWTLDSFSAALEIAEPHRRWAYESAALDLALRQAGRSLAQALDREPRPVRFVVSAALGDDGAEPSVAPLRRWLELYPGLRFKLDPASSWDDELVAELAATGTVDTVDLKAYYRNPEVDPPPDAALYARVAEGFPDAWIEDPALTAETEPVLEPHRERITWDAPIHSVADVEACAYPPRTLNSKPSRFGSLRALCDFYDHCEAHGIALYGGGMFELGPGRGQIQYLASLFHPDAPNDVAPRGFNSREPLAGLPESPLEPAPDATGFRWTSVG
jgi:hypothetical protein